MSGETRVAWREGLFANRGEASALLGLAGDVAVEELLPRLYERFGLAALPKVNGTLSWILWDGARRRLLAVADRVGIRPIHFTVRSGFLHLAGSPEPLLDLADATAAAARRPTLDPAALNPAAVAAHLHGEAPPPGETFHRSISVLAPGGYLLASEGQVRHGTYWQLAQVPALRLPDDAAYAEELWELLVRVVGEYADRAGRMGIALSSGLDSTGLAAALRQAAPDSRLTAFSWTAPELPATDEGPPAQRAARRLGCPIVLIRGDLCWPLRDGIRLSRASPSAPYYSALWDAIFQAVRSHGESLLFSGHSGDHLFGGNVYSYPDLLLTGRWLRLVNEIRAHRRRTGRALPWIVRWMILGPIARATSPLLPGRRPVAWLGPALAGEVAARPRLALPRLVLPGRQQRLQLLRDRSLGAATALIDAQAGEHGISFRHPWLDHRLLEFAASLPSTQTFEAAVRKGILRRVLAGRVPDEILAQPDKTVPAALLDRGLRERETAKVWRLLTGMRAAELGWVDEELLRAEYQAYLDGRIRRTRFWHALTLEAWLRRWFQP